MGLGDHLQGGEVVTKSHIQTIDVDPETLCVDELDTSVPSQIECSSTNLGSPVSAHNHTMVYDLTMLRESTQSMDSVLENLNNSAQADASAWRADNDGMLTQESGSAPHESMHEDAVERTGTGILPDQASDLKATPSFGLDARAQVACLKDGHHWFDNVQQKRAASAQGSVASAAMSLFEEQALLIQELEELSASCTSPGNSVVVPADLSIGIVGDICIGESIRHGGSGDLYALELGASPNPHIDVDGKQGPSHECTTRVENSDQSGSTSGVEGQFLLPGGLETSQPRTLSSQKAEFVVPQQIPSSDPSIVGCSTSLHNEIQALQKRILDRLKSPPPPPTRQSSQRITQTQPYFRHDLVAAP